MTIVLANGYAGTLFSFLSVAKLEPVINSLEDLANSDVNLMIQAHTDLSLRFLVQLIFYLNHENNVLNKYF